MRYFKLPDSKNLIKSCAIEEGEYLLTIKYPQAGITNEDAGIVFLVITESAYGEVFFDQLTLEELNDEKFQRTYQFIK